MYVTVDNEREGLTKALKVFSRMVKQSELMQEIRNRRYYLKPSERKAFKKKESFRRRKRDERRMERQNHYNK
jgi:ribosomal protein S21